VGEKQEKREEENDLNKMALHIFTDDSSQLLKFANG